jgi:hypothetical protein
VKQSSLGLNIKSGVRSFIVNLLRVLSTLNEPAWRQSIKIPKILAAKIEAAMIKKISKPDRPPLLDPRF